MPMHNHPHTATMPEPWVLRASHRVAPGSCVIDLACGSGRNGRWFLANEHPVVFVDRDVAGVADLSRTPAATVVEADLEAAGFAPETVLPPRTFGGVVVVNYLWRPLLPSIVAAVAPGGVLVYQTFAAGNQRFGKPSNPDFLLDSGELLEAVRGQLEVLGYEHGEGLTERPAVVQRIVARRPR
ncbi:MAG: class I SAM-dependent methyltransferase [Alphaproteobacteria bacterium]